MRLAVLVTLGACWTGDVPPPAPPLVLPPPLHVRRHVDRVAPVGDPIAGARLVDQLGCVACHSIDGTVRIGPSWRRIFGTFVTTADGRVLRVDDDYLHRAILHPQVDVVATYPPVMPSFESVLTPQQVDNLVAYIKSLH